MRLDRLGTAALLALCPLAAGPGEIERAVQNLGSPRFQVREQASRTLWEAGPKAEEALRKAADSGDAEVARRARQILAKFEWGIFPDTPREVVTLIQEFRTGNAAAKQRVAVRLVGLGRPGYAVLKRLLAREPNPSDRQAVAAHATAEAQRVMGGLLLAGDLDAAEDLLESCLSGQSPEAATNFAAFHHLRGTTDAAAARYERLRAEAPKPAEDDEEPAAGPAGRAAEVLAYLYKAKGDLPRAAQAAQAARDPHLVEALRWEAGDWKELAKADLVVSQWGGPGVLGMRAAYHRLAGNPAEAKKATADLKKMAEDSADAGESFEGRAAVLALLLNREVADALGVLRAKRTNAKVLFEVLAAQARPKEALDLLEKWQADGEVDAGELRDLALRRARVLYSLGEKDRALQAFSALADKLRQPNDAAAAADLVKAVGRLGLRDRAADTAAALLDRLVKAGPPPDDALVKFFEPVVGRPRADLALVWWTFLRAKGPNDEPAATMRRVRDLLGDAPDPASAELCAALVKEPNAKPLTWQAAAEVHRRAGRFDPAADALKRAATVAGATALDQLKAADFLAGRGRFREAAAAYEKAGEMAATDPVPDKGEDDASPSSGVRALALYLQGWSLERAGDAQAGKRLTELSHWLPLGRERARVYFAEELAKRDRTEAARRERELALTLGWQRANHWFMGNLINAAARDAVARRQFARAAELYERSVLCCLRTGAAYVEPSAYLLVPHATLHHQARALASEGKLAEALVLAEKCLEAMPGDVDLALALVPELDRRGEKAKADEVFARVLAPYVRLAADYPNGAWVRNSLAWVSAGCRRRLDAALADAQKAVELAPGNAGFMDTLAEVHYRRGDRDRATAVMEQCRKLDPDNPYFRRQLVRFKKGDPLTDAPDEGEDD